MTAILILSCVVAYVVVGSFVGFTVYERWDKTSPSYLDDGTSEVASLLAGMFWPLMLPVWAGRWAAVRKMQ